jgi:hypothetical protein
MSGGYVMTICKVESCVTNTDSVWIAALAGAPRAIVRPLNCIVVIEAADRNGGGVSADSLNNNWKEHVLASLTLAEREPPVAG